MSTHQENLKIMAREVIDANPQLSRSNFRNSEAVSADDFVYAVVAEKMKRMTIDEFATLHGARRATAEEHQLLDKLMTSLQFAKLNDALRAATLIIAIRDELYTS